MNPLRRGLIALPVAALLTAWVGCGESKPQVETSQEEATVKGKVIIKGQPAKGGVEVTFDPSNYLRKADLRTAKVQDDGTYEVKTLVGTNRIRLSGDAMKAVPRAAHKSWSLDVKKGDNPYDIELGAETSPKAAAPVRPGAGGSRSHYK